ncbi:MAG: NAD(P)-dependent oxidoreductase, partial [Parvularculaceae bacterium]|nr:NAD(P)-dependent oxidoreductase [Parvularculaceae bacterium]
AFAHASSGGLYGGGIQPIDETAPLAIAGRLKHYLSTKRAAELLADAYDGHFSVCALRYFFIYGAGQKPHMLMPRLAASVREGRALTLQGSDGMRMNPVHVADAAAATVAALKTSARGVVNIAGPETVSIRDIGTILGRALGRAPVFETTAGAPSDLVADIANMRATLGAPKITPESGLADALR